MSTAQQPYEEIAHALVLQTLPTGLSSADVHTGAVCTCGGWLRGGMSQERVWNDFVEHWRTEMGVPAPASTP